MQSQRWVFMSPGGENDYKKPSVTHQHYGDSIALENKRKIEKKETENEKKRREFERDLWKKMSKKMLDQMKENEEKLMKDRDVQEIGSLYGDSYIKPGFKVKELGTDIDEELVKKYGPLCTDTSKSVDLKNMYYQRKARPNMHRPIESLFRRNDQFTNRLSNPNDRHAPNEKCGKVRASGDECADLAAPSACSLPGILECPGIQVYVMFLPRQKHQIADHLTEILNPEPDNILKIIKFLEDTLLINKI